MAFKEVLLGDYFKFEKGLGYKGEFLAEESDVALIGMDSHEEGGGYKEGSEKFYTGPFKPEHIAEVGDVIFAGTEQGFGLLASPLIVPESDKFTTYLFSGDVLKAVPLKPEEFSVEYLYNLYRVEKFRLKTAYGDTGTTVRRISNDNFAEQIIPLPDLATQQAINDLISMIDQQIANNKALSKSLEVLAQAMFKSWFIDFDPVHAKSNGEKPFGMDDATAALFPSTFEKSEIGDIPKGWHIKPLGELITNFDSKRKPISARKRAERKGKYPYYGATGIVDYVDDFLFQGRYLLVGEDGSVINTNGTPVIQYVWGDFWVNNHAHVLQPKNELDFDHLYLILRNTDISEYVTGAVQLKLNQLNMNSIPVLFAGTEINQVFGQIVSEIYDEYRTLQESSKSLQDLLSALLPNLITGDLHFSSEMIAS
jgi:type I restriction enzyme S subunit